MKINSISIVIPILNEEKNLIKLTNEIKKIKKKLKIKNFELIFVDDNSSDNSKIILQNLSLKNKFLRFYIRKATDRDLSKSCIVGFEKHGIFFLTRTFATKEYHNKVKEN